MSSQLLTTSCGGEGWAVGGGVRPRPDAAGSRRRVRLHCLRAQPDDVGRSALGWQQVAPVSAHWRPLVVTGCVWPRAGGRAHPSHPRVRTLMGFALAPASRTSTRNAAWWAAMASGAIGVSQGKLRPWEAGATFRSGANKNDSIPPTKFFAGYRGSPQCHPVTRQVGQSPFSYGSSVWHAASCTCYGTPNTRNRAALRRRRCRVWAAHRPSSRAARRAHALAITHGEGLLMPVPVPAPIRDPTIHISISDSMRVSRHDWAATTAGRPVQTCQGMRPLSSR